ncbi:trypsin-like serine protease [Streptomyces flavofungini]|uniref:trypsin-like serine protease n=1 Tax=Streptomyces flavofungini TaxID=68200 RepID=UPI0034DEA06E
MRKPTGPAVAAALATSTAMTATLMAASPAQAIVGGTQSHRAYAFLGSFQPAFPKAPRPDGHGCGVEVLAPQWVLTASHCAAKNPTEAKTGVPKNWKVRIGSLKTTSGGEVAEVDHYYRLSTWKEKLWGKDIALMHLRTPVRAKPVRIASKSPRVGAPVRIMGWGMTCYDDTDAKCYPERLREADTKVQPPSTCSATTTGGKELCVGGRNGRPTAANMDSGGPALTRENGQWALAGVVSRGDIDAPTSYTDVTQHADWINSVISGAHVPPDSAIPDVEGAVDLHGCVGSVIRTPTSRPQDPALLLTNGHCVEGERPKPGTALVDKPADREAPIADHQGYPKATARANRLLYATMSGTDIALYRLNTSYGQLEAKGAKVFRLASTAVRTGDPLALADAAGRRKCTAEAVVPHLREGGYQQDNAIRYRTAKDCDPGHGMSGSALLAPDGRTVVGIHNTHNDPNADAEPCADNKPCEVRRDGAVSSKDGRGYGQQTHAITDCLARGTKLDLTLPKCTLTDAADHRAHR